MSKTQLASPDDLLTLDEVAERLRVRVNTLKSWRGKGRHEELGLFICGGKLVARRSAVEAFIASEEEAPRLRRS